VVSDLKLSRQVCIVGSGGREEEKKEEKVMISWEANKPAFEQARFVIGIFRRELG
jgi:hypothetical protein